MSSSTMNATTAGATDATAGGTGAGAGAGGQGGGAGAGGQGVSPDEMLVYWFDIVLLCVVGVFFLAFLPRAIGRFSNFSEWMRGLVLRSGQAPEPLIQQPRVYDDRLARVNTMTTLADDSSDQSHTLANHNTYAYARSGKEWASAPVSSGVTISPAHIPALSSLLHPFSKLVSYPVSSGMSIGKILVVFAYIMGIHFLVLFDGGNPLADSKRMGFIAVSQIPVVIALGTKNNVVGMLLGMGYERLNFLHRIVGVTIFLTATVHAAGFIYKFAINGALSESLQSPSNRSGLLGLTGLQILFLTSSSGVRQSAYTFFLYSHVIGMAVFFTGICLHYPVIIKYVLLSVGIYGFDHLFRIIKTRITTARLSAVPELGLTRLELPNVNAGWRAGQHVRLRVLSGEMGLLGWTIAHPFTIASAEESGSGLVLMCKKTGGWTGKLYRAASQAGAFGSEEGYGASRVREMKVIVEGPYGGVGNMVMASYSSVLLVAGGSGITFGLSAVEELVQAITSGRSAVKFIELVWVAQEKDSLCPLLPTFSGLLNSVANMPGVVLRFSVHYTRAEKADSNGKTTASSLNAHLSTLAPNLTLQAGRPSFPRVTRSIASVTSGVPHAKGLAVGVCGPGGLVGEVHKAVRGVDSELRAACGGIEIHEEMFGW